MYDYTIAPEPSEKEFLRACGLIEKAFPEAEKRKLLVDVDYSKIQIYTIGADEIIVYNCFEVGAVYVRSTVDLTGIL